MHISVPKRVDIAPKGSLAGAGLALPNCPYLIDFFGEIRKDSWEYEGKMLFRNTAEHKRAGNDRQLLK